MSNFLEELSEFERAEDARSKELLEAMPDVNKISATLNKGVSPEAANEALQRIYEAYPAIVKQLIKAGADNDVVLTDLCTIPNRSQTEIVKTFMEVNPSKAKAKLTEAWLKACGIEAPKETVSNKIHHFFRRIPTI